MHFNFWILSLSVFLSVFSACGGNREDPHDEDIDWMVKENLQPSQHQNLAEEQPGQEKEERLR